MQPSPSMLLSEISFGMPGITPAMGSVMYECACICLSEQSHSDGVKLLVIGDHDESYQLAWAAPDEQMIRGYADEEKATELGACCIAVLAIQELTGHAVIEQARKGTAVDYWLGLNDGELLQKKARLEVSGIRSGDRNAAIRRSAEREVRLQPKGRSYASYIVIVEFGTPFAHTKVIENE